MTAQGQLAEPPSPKATKDPKVHTTSKARQKKFLRHFPNVEEDEKVLNHYSCALIGDILLQGHLYITKNYFAFYSNVFGYVTKVCTVFINWHFTHFRYLCKFTNLPLITATDSNSHSRRNNQRKNRQDNTKRSGHNDERGQAHFRQFDVQRQHACLHENCLGKSEKRGSLTRTGNYRKLSQKNYNFSIFF